MSRVTRAQTLRLKEREFVLASRTLGESTFSIIFREILPNIFGQIIVMCMMTIPNAIFTEAFLAFIGLGIPAPLASLGSDQRRLQVHDHVSLPGALPGHGAGTADAELQPDGRRPARRL